MEPLVALQAAPVDFNVPLLAFFVVILLASVVARADTSPALIPVALAALLLRLLVRRDLKLKLLAGVETLQ